jgi:large subunit ribosomal protein L9
MTKKVKKEVQIVLAETIPNLGKLGSLVYVKSGYARNYILPLQKGVFSTTTTIKLLERKQKNLDLKEKLNIQLCLKNKIILEQNYPYIIQKRISENNKIFGKVTLKQVRTLLENKTNLDFTNIIIEVPEIKETGIYSIDIILHTTVKTQIKIEILPQ